MSKAPAYLFFSRGLRGGVAGALTWLAAKEIPDIHSEPRPVARNSAWNSNWGIGLRPVELLPQRLVGRERRDTLPGDVTG